MVNRPQQCFDAMKLRMMAALALSFSGAAAVAASSSDVPSGERLARFPMGGSLVYDVQYSNTSVADFASMAGATNASAAQRHTNAPTGSQTFETSIKGSLIATVLRADSRETLLLFSLHNIDLGISYNELPAKADAERIEAALSRDFYATVTREGIIGRLEFAPEMDTTAQGFARAILAGLQFVTPSGQVPPNSWDVEEQDANGTYLAHYERTATNENQSAPRVFIKKKLKYLPRTDPAGSRVTTVPLTIVPEGDTLVTEDPATGNLLSVRAIEHQVISLSGRTLADSKSEFTVTLKSSNALSSSDTEQLFQQHERLSPSLIATSLYERKRDKVTEDRRRQEILGDATEESLLQGLIAIEIAGSDQAKSQLAERLEALFLLRPETCQTFQNILKTSAAGGTSFRLLITVLGRVGHAEAQAVLRTALQARLEEKPAVMLLIYALSSGEAPTPETETCLREIAFGGANFQIARSAQLALGTLANHLATSEPQRAAEVVREISVHIESSPTTEAKARLLGALGNARTPEAARIVQGYLDGPSADLRETALSLMARIQPDGADQILTTYLLNDASEGVRLTAARELASRKATERTFDAQKKALTKELAANVRITLLSGLWQARGTFPEAAAVVRNAAKEDSSRQVRETAAKLLTNSSPST